jgi:hypothetical protein
MGLFYIRKCIFDYMLKVWITMGIFKLINLTTMIDLTINQIKHLVKLDFKIPPNQIG